MAVALAHGTQQMPKDVPSNLSALARRALLVEAVVHAAEDARVIDIVGDLLPARVVHHHVGYERVGQRDRVAVLAEHASSTRRAAAPKPACPDG